jgi:uncharacterized membrane protein YhaH (DUF805 family)
MEAPSNKDIRGSWRRALFWAWILASALVALYIGIAEPLDSYLGRGSPTIALALPALMVFMLATGLGWLILLVTSGRRK